MTLGSYLNSQFGLMQYIDFFIRILVAAIAGGIIGLERSHRFKEAGIRTHIIVCCTTAVLMIISKYGFVDLTDPSGNYYNGTRGTDSARIAAQAVSGISFLCAGVIFKIGNNVRGLTTAAGLWFTAALGLAFGAGMYYVGVFALFILFVLQLILHSFIPTIDSYSGNELHFKVRDTADFYEKLIEQINSWDARIIENNVSYNSDDTVDYNIVVRRKEAISFDELRKFADIFGNNIISYRNNSLKNHIR